jgi:hypothetical protein
MLLNKKLFVTVFAKMQIVATRNFVKFSLFAEIQKYIFILTLVYCLPEVGTCNYLFFPQSQFRNLMRTTSATEYPQLFKEIFFCNDLFQRSTFSCYNFFLCCLQLHIRNRLRKCVQRKLLQNCDFAPLNLDFRYSQLYLSGSEIISIIRPRFRYEKHYLCIGR